ncbi:MAG: dCMP deaminase family protein [Clostridiales bacterium]|jgi:dCMP deaminase|nr:dCMP deaminase family protein [Clostridiales bacterium]
MRKVLNWDEYFMSLAHLSAVRSKDPSTQVGAVIVDSNNRVVGLGYNGFPRGCDDNKFPWEREGEYLDTKYAYVVHAELNAILNANKLIENCRLYVSLFPCNECSKAIIQSGIKEIIYESDKYKDLDQFKASKKMLEAAGVKLRQLDYEIDLNIKINKKN